MARKSKAKFIMKGHALPGIKQIRETKSDLGDGRHESSPFQMVEAGDSPNKNFFKKAFKALNPINHLKRGLGVGKSLLKGDVRGAVKGLNPLSVLDTGGAAAAGGGDPALAAQPVVQEQAVPAAGVGQVPVQMKMDKTKTQKTVGGRLGGGLYKSSGLKQQGPKTEGNIKLQPSEMDGTSITGNKGDSDSEKINDYEDRISFIKEDIYKQDGKPTPQQKKDMAKLQGELDIIRKQRKKSPPLKNYKKGYYGIK
jgi:hypothetical protein